MRNLFRIPVGDPSDDGHGKSEYVTIKCNKTKEQIKEAYKKSCEKTGLVFTSNTEIIVNGEKLNWQHPEYNARQICVNYQNYSPSELAYNILKENGVEEAAVDGSSYNLVHIFMEFIKISLNDLEFEVVENNIDTLDLTIGYGIFD